MKIKLHYTLLLFIGLGLVCGIVKNIIVIYFLITLHELGHLFFLRVFKRKINSITVLPFGGLINYENNENVPLYQDFLINGGGLFVNVFLLLIFKKGLFHEYNVVILIFNALPVYPLDGGRILEVVLSKVFKFRHVYGLLSILSIILIVFIFLFNVFTLNALSTNLIFLFLLLENFKLFKDRKAKYKHFLLNKYLHPNDKLKNKKIKSPNIISSFYKGVNNVLFHKGKVIKESTILKNFFKR